MRCHLLIAEFDFKILVLHYHCMQLAHEYFSKMILVCLNVDIYSVYENNTAIKSTTLRDDDVF